MKMHFLIGFVLLLSLTVVYAQFLQEENSVSRIVGDSPTELLRQLKTTELSFEDPILYEGNYDDKSLFSPGYIAQQRFDRFDRQLGNIPRWGIKADNDFYMFNKQARFEIEDALRWQDDFERYKPFFFLSIEGSGEHLPKQDSVVRRLVRDSTIIAPKSYSSNAFQRAFLCSINNDETLGQAYLNARNYFYNEDLRQDVTKTNYILQSYGLFGNPMQSLDIEYPDVSFVAQYCKNYLKNLEKDVTYLGEEGGLQKFRRTIAMNITNVSIVQIGNYSVLSIPPAYNLETEQEPYLPLAVRSTYFPKDSIITSYQLRQKTNPIQVDVDLLQTSQGLLEPLECNSLNDSIEFTLSQNSYEQAFVALIKPVYSPNCQDVYVNTYYEYTIDYVTRSPVVFDSIDYKPVVGVDTIQDIVVDLRAVTTNQRNGTLSLYLGNEIVAEKAILSTDDVVTLTYLAQEIQGVYTYSVEYKENGETLYYQPISVSQQIIIPSMNVPINIRGATTYLLNLDSYVPYILDGTIQWFFYNNQTLLSQGEKNMAFNTGTNQYSLSTNNVPTNSDEYRLVFYIHTTNETETISYDLVSNNKPSVVIEEKNLFVGETAQLKLYVVDIDGDRVSLSSDDVIVFEPEYIEVPGETYQIGTYAVEFTPVNEGNFTFSIQVNDNVSFETYDFDLVINSARGNTECSDLIDNDFDGLVDLDDDGCDSVSDDSEYANNEPITSFVQGIQVEFVQNGSIILRVPNKYIGEAYMEVLGLR